ncbi:MAG TPA: hypothetical protein VER33_13785 [Polyangiaceae bacterium]|nr:hypothetical protein [Polyangiaceae bacterium]
MINTGKLWALGGVCLLAAGCVYGPFHDDTIASTTSRITFNLYATQTEAVMTAECATHSSGFSAFGSKTGSASPTTLNGESIYAAQLERVIPASCWDFGFGKPVTYLRFFQTKDGQTYNVMTFDNAGRTCIRDHFADGEGPVTAGFACAKTDNSNQLRLFAER